MTKIKMLKTMPVSPTGLVTVTWPEGSIQNASDVILDALISVGACEIVEDKAEKPALETGAPVAPQPKRAPRKKKAD